MAMLGKIFLTLFVLLFPLSSYSKPYHHECAHDSMSSSIEFIDVPYETDLQGRMLATYEKIRILFDFSCKSKISRVFDMF